MAVTYDFEIDSSHVPSDLTDFPVRLDLANLSTAIREDLAANIDASGNGFRVKDSGGTVLDYTLENFSNAGSTVVGELVFRCSPTSASNLGLKLTADSALSNNENQSGVYSSVDNAYNFEQDPSVSDLIDIAGSLDLPTNGSMTSGDKIPGIFGNCWQFDGVNDGAGSTSTHWPSTTIGEWSFIVWVMDDAAGNDDVFLSNDGSGWDQSFQIGIYPENVGSSGKLQCNHQGSGSLGGRHTVAASHGMTAGQWYQVAIVVRSDAYMRLFVDGAEVNSVLLNGPGGRNLSPGDLYVGSKQTIREWPGRINDVHLFESDLSDDWIEFDHLNMTESDNCLVNWAKETAGGIVTPYYYLAN